MAPRDAMQEVHVDDEEPSAGLPADAAGARRPSGDVPTGRQPGSPDAGTGPAADPVARRRRAVLRWWPAAVVAVVAVLAAQLVVDARERDRVGAARDVEGVIAYDVGPELRTERVAVEDVAPASSVGALAGGVRVRGEQVPFGRPRAVLAVDAETGDDAWRTEVETQAEATAAPVMASPWCWAAAPEDADGSAEAAGAAATRVRCFVQDRLATQTGGGGYTEDSPTRARLLTLDAGTGAVVDEHELAPRSSVDLVGSALVVGEVGDGDVVRVRAEDVVTGESLWSTSLGQEAGLDPVYDPHVTADGDHVLVQVGSRQRALAVADGALEADGTQLWVGRTGDLLVQDALPGAVRFAGPDGAGDAVVPGTPLPLAVDDGSAPELELLSAVVDGDRVVRAVDRAGRTAWQAQLDGQVDGSALVLDGVLYGVDAVAAWAVNLHDGQARWRTVRALGDDGEPARTPSGSWVSPLTDGRVLLLLEGPDGPAPELVAWSLRSGEELWRSPLPPELGGWLSVWDGALYGERGTGDEVVRVVG